jgi:rRNA maturation protein Nop10
MFRFICPRCQFGMEAKESKAGTKTNCKKCGQKLMIPLPPKFNTGRLSGFRRGKKKRSPKDAQPFRIGNVEVSREVMRRFVGIVFLVLLIGGGYLGYKVIPSLLLKPAADEVEVRSSPKHWTERQVADLILKLSSDPDKIQFEKWGPHLYRNEWEQMLRQSDEFGRSKAKGFVKDPHFECVVRLVYKAPHRTVVGKADSTQLPPQEHDELFVVHNDSTPPDLVSFQSGDEWKERLKRLVLPRQVEDEGKQQLDILRQKQSGK